MAFLVVLIVFRERGADEGPARRGQALLDALHRDARPGAGTSSGEAMYLVKPQTLCFGFLSIMAFQ